MVGGYSRVRCAMVESKESLARYVLGLKGSKSYLRDEALQLIANALLVDCYRDVFGMWPTPDAHPPAVLRGEVMKKLAAAGVPAETIEGITDALLKIRAGQVRKHNVGSDGRLSRAEGGCRWWGCADVGTQTDHVVPISLGGEDTEANTVSLCSWHNGIKGGNPLMVMSWTQNRGGL
jgi:5-methylcytosine-specific restriction endonuclease McrA